MYINKYGILIKKILNEKYPKKYEELENKRILLKIIQDKQIEIVKYKRKLIEQNIPITKNKMVKIQDSIHKKIERIVQEINLNEKEYEV